MAQERTRIARELHYSVGQELVGTALQLDSAAARLAERGPGATLTVRKLEVLELVSKGLSNREIAAALGCSETTAKWHLKNIMSKLDGTDRTEATRAAVERGILHVE